MGAVLPLLPTTPFLLLAGACFVRSSPRLYAKLEAHPKLGPYLVEWKERRSIPAHAKFKAYALVIVSFSFSIMIVGRWPLRALLGGIGGALLVFLHRLETSSDGRFANRRGLRRVGSRRSRRRGRPDPG